MAESLRQKEKILADREERLWREGVRRSERLKKINHTQLAEDIYIPHEARNDKNWQEAMENELESLSKHNV